MNCDKRRPARPPCTDWTTFRPTAAHGATLLQAHFTGHAFERHSHATYSVGVTHSGVQCFNSHGARHASVEGDLILFNPDEAHDGSAGTAEGFGYTILYLEPALLQAWAPDTRASAYFSATVVRDPGAAAVLRQTMAALCQPQETLRAETLAGAAIARLLQHYGEHRAQGERLAMPGAASMAMVRDYIDAHFNQDLGVDALARLAGLSRVHLTRSFTRHYGTPPHVYLNMVRLRHARLALLRDTSLADTAAASGFADQSHFTRRFKRSVGVAPGAWLRQMRAPG